jgi:glutathione S-transferase
MDKAVTLYHMPVSPNSIKARVALAYKKIPHEKVTVDSANREPIIKLSSQPLTPVLKHGDAVIFDSYAILRYLDANFPGTPRLYSADRPTIKSIEQWELFTRNEAGPAVSMMFGQMSAPTPDPEKVKQANALINRAAARTEETLKPGGWLVGDAPTAADLTVATMLYPGAVPEAATQKSRAEAFFHKHLKIESAPKTIEWIGRVMAWDR